MHALFHTYLKREKSPFKMTGMLGTYRLQKALGKRDLGVACAFNLQETNLIFRLPTVNPTNST